MNAKTKAGLEEQKIQAIMQECRMHNDDIGAEGRSEADLRSDARFILMSREGINPETLCMMLTDTGNNVREARAELTRLRTVLAGLPGRIEAMRAATNRQRAEIGGPDVGDEYFPGFNDARDEAAELVAAALAEVDKLKCECATCHGEGLIGSDGETCACIKMGCRKAHGRDAYMPARQPILAPVPSEARAEAMAGVNPAAMNIDRGYDPFDPNAITADEQE